jgi:hypothetical protein
MDCEYLSSGLTFGRLMRMGLKLQKIKFVLKKKTPQMAPKRKQVKELEKSCGKRCHIPC